MKRIIQLGFFVLFSFVMIGYSTGGSGACLLKESPGPDQEVRMLQGVPVIISKKVYTVVVSPESILTEPGAPLQFTVSIGNTTPEPMEFNLEGIRVFSDEKRIGLLPAEKVVDRVRKEYSAEKLDLSKNQEKMLDPFVEEKIQMTRESLLRDRTILPGENVKGIIAIELPTGSHSLSIEIAILEDIHKFRFDVFEL